MRLETLCERHRQMIISGELTDKVIAYRIGISTRSIMRYRKMLQTNNNLPACSASPKI